MLAAKIKSVEDIKFPVIVSPKLDGIRCLRINGKAVSRSFKPIPNRHINKLVSEQLIDNIDGEIISGSNFQECTSNVMSHNGEPDFKFYAFDQADDLSTPYHQRANELECITTALGIPWLVSVPYFLADNIDMFLKLEQVFLADGYEGIIVRDPDGPYKCGRSTLKQGWLLKLKSEDDSEAEIIGFEEMLINENEQERDELGYAKRSTAKAGQVPGGTLGKFLVRDIHTNIEFSIGTGRGLTAALRQDVWDNQDKYLGKLVKYRYQDVGVKEKPRCPSYQGFRHPEDL
jgi:DNA ligase-1